MKGRNVPSKIAYYIDMSSKWVGYVLAPFILVLIGITIYDIISRNIGITTLWPFDVEWFIWAAFLTLTMVYAVRTGSHVSVDLLTSHYSKRTQYILIAVSYALFIIPLMVVLVIYGWEFGFKSFQRGEETLAAWGGLLWPVKFLIFAASILMIPQSLVELIRSIQSAIKVPGRQSHEQ